MPVARGTAALLANDRARQPHDGDVRAPRSEPRGPRRGAGVRALSAPQGAREAARGHAVRWRAADGRDRTRAHGAPEAPHARRAVPRPRADPRGNDLSRVRGDQPAGDADPPRRAERHEGARDRAPRVRARDRERGPARHRQGAPRVARRAARLPRYVTSSLPRLRGVARLTLPQLRVPPDVERVVAKLLASGYEAYVVGGSVRDAIRGVEPHDWDVTTSATPEEIQKVFRRSLYLNHFGTVVVRSGDHEIEVTTYRIEAGYADHRHPSEVAFTDSLHEDLARRDFTMNAMAWRPGTQAGPGELVDPFGGQRDLESRIVRAVGDPRERFQEDALRMLRAVRFATLLGFTIEPATAEAIRASAHLAAALSGERIQMELTKMLGAPKPSVALRMLSDLGLLEVICPELELCKTTPQDKAVAQDVFEQSLATVDATPADDPVLRLAGLFHDIGKPATFADGHFHQHEFVGEAKAREILRRWRFDKDTIAQVTHLIRHHMFWYQTEWTGSAVRRFVRKVGLENIPALFRLRRADNIGSGARSPRMYALEALWERVQEEIAAAAAFSLRDLAVNGNDVMQELRIASGPEVGRILAELFERVLDDPALNTRERLLALAREIERKGPG